MKDQWKLQENEQFVSNTAHNHSYRTPLLELKSDYVHKAVDTNATDKFIKVMRFSG
jgi:hypothetical protein